ncbi:MAG: XTP/dITP diphosphatase [Anaeroplasmataceae bacterium]|nr:XTP/dITP diphosphatase [Anaeroplasmataceae bacterium]
MRTIVIATNNLGKLREFQDLFPQDKVIALADISYTKEIMEDGLTFEENAIQKAKQVALDIQMTVIADDSGLEVEALHGEPGIYSARYAGNHDSKANNELLLKKLKGISNRKAQFVCVLCLYKPNGEYILSKGICKGEITEEAKGTNGFGYDPYFYVKEYGKTFAELPISVKNQISHRAIAMKKLREYMDEAISD